MKIGDNVKVIKGYPKHWRGIILKIDERKGEALVSINTAEIIFNVKHLKVIEN